MVKDKSYEKLNPEQKKFVKSVFASFEHAGVLLNAETEKLIQ